MSKEHYMKKIYMFITWVILLSILLTSCGNMAGHHKDDIITVEDGYLVVNGNKTEYKIDDEKPNMPDESVKEDDIITVEDGYLVVNGNKTEYKVDKEVVIELIDGYVVVNGIRTEYYVPECNHRWETSTVEATCTTRGYDLDSCSLCGKTVIFNETDIIDHTYESSYSTDDNYHWFKCTECAYANEKRAHSIDDSGICSVCSKPIFETPGIIYDISSDGTYAEVVAYEGTATYIKIAAEYNGLPVKTIYNSAFQSKNITNIEIPDTVTTIGKMAFYGSNLKSISIPDSVTTIGNQAFAYCSNLTEITIGTGIKEIGYNAFNDILYEGHKILNVHIKDLTHWCSIKFNSNPIQYAKGFYVNGELISDLIIPDDVISVESNAFSGYSKLLSVTIPDNVQSIGYSAFSYCSNLKSIIIGDGVKSIGSYAFRYCPITELVMGENVESIGGYAFEGCSMISVTEYNGCEYIGSKTNPYFILFKAKNNYMSNYVIHQDTVIIAHDAFHNCTRLSEIIIPEGVKQIGYFAFRYCTSLSKIILPNSVKIIDGYAFAECGNLTSIVIQKNVHTIEWGAFNNCNKLYNIYYTGTYDDWKKISITDMSNEGLHVATIHYNHIIEE